MSSYPIHVVILAAGRGERMRAAFPGIPKSLVPLDHTPMLVRLLRTLQSSVLEVNAITIVVRPEEKDLFS
jgi:2-C-methyl-D-erythritol 4-phosphate cytidylyltransferase